MGHRAVPFVERFDCVCVREREVLYQRFHCVCCVVDGLFTFSSFVLHRAVYLTTCQCFFFVSFVFISEFISIGFEAPAGQSYSSAADLAKLMALMFSTDKPHDLKTGQVGVVQITQIIKIKGSLAS